MSADPARRDAGWAGVRRHRLSRLMLARLGLSILAFGLALALFGVGSEDASLGAYGLYGTLAFAFGVTALYAARFHAVRNLSRFAALQLGTDVAIVTALVVFSGGVDSIFSFLYLPITVYGAILFDRRGAYGSAVVASLCYGAALVGSQWVQPAAGLGGGVSFEVGLALWGVHAGALLLVALLASALSRELQIAGERLRESTSDLARMRRLYQRTVESLQSGLLTLDSEDRVTSFNPEAARITGHSLAEVRGRTLEEVLPGAQLPSGPAGSTRARLRYEMPDGSERHLGLSASVLREADGEPTGRVVIFQDLTEVVAMEEELRRSERLAGVGQLAADIAHEIRNPLAAISGSVEMLWRDEVESGAAPEQARLMGIVLREIERLDGLITDFLAYARPAPPKPEPVRLAGVVAEVLEMFEAAKPPELRVETAVDPEIQVLVDATQMRQVLWNLITNAAQATEGAGRLRIAAERRSGASQDGVEPGRNDGEEEALGVEIAVSDTGSGIDPEVMERIFDPFFTTKSAGTGLGLATVHRIVEGNGGTLHVESQPGSGSTFRIRLPAAGVSS